MRVKIKNVYYCKHPDFIQDDSAPKGYIVLDTAKWVVEWDIVPYNITIPGCFLKKHCRASFPTEEEARIFHKKISKHCEADSVTLLEDFDFLDAV
jgi:hypothetical protein